jgi:hypothetical protein
MLINGEDDLLMKIKVFPNNGEGFFVELSEVKTLEEAADYLAGVDWVKTTKGLIVFTKNIAYIWHDGKS